MQIFSNPEEYFYLHCLTQWERTAPPDGHQGVSKNGRIKTNTQTARMAFLLSIIDDGDERTFRGLAKRTGRRDGRSYVSKDRSWMREPYELRKGWYFEGNMSLRDKEKILRQLPFIGAVSEEFVGCAQDFVAGKSIMKYWPRGEANVAKWKARFGNDPAFDL